MSFRLDKYICTLSYVCLFLRLGVCRCVCVCVSVKESACKCDLTCMTWASHSLLCMILHATRHSKHQCAFRSRKWRVWSVKAPSHHTWWLLMCTRELPASNNPVRWRGFAISFLYYMFYYVLFTIFTRDVCSIQWMWVS